MSRRWRPRAVAVLLTAAATIACMTGVALADGDPGSDVLLAQNLFTFSGLNVQEQLQLGRLLDAAQRAGDPIKVAVIDQKDALGTVTPLWRKPQTYASYLGYELSQTYRGRLLIVMPNGFGVIWTAKGASGADQMLGALRAVKVQGVTGRKLLATVTEAVDRLEGAAGVSTRQLDRYQRASGSMGGAGAGGYYRPPRANTNRGSSTTTTGRHKLPTGWFAAILLLLGVLYVAYRSGRLRSLRLPQFPRRGAGQERESKGGLFGLGVSPFALLPAGILVLVVLVLLAQGGGTSASQSALLARNASLDPGTALAPTPAPDFALADQTGREINLKQYRGKVVILSFIDAECQTVCPLTSQAMLDAKRALGSSGRDVQLLAVNANWKSTQIDDVLNYTQMHGMTGAWNFLTGDRAQLERVWSDYHVNELNLIKHNSNNIDHLAATYVIDPQGRERRVYLTNTAYAAVPQFGQLLAHEASALLPGHPAVRSRLSYAQVSGVSPRARTSLPAENGGTVTLGPGKAHLYVFFASWDRQTTALAPDLKELDRYVHAEAKDKLPALTAVDEGSVEPSPDALTRFLNTQVRTPLDYPIAIDQTGRVADGYGVQGDPWFVLVSPSGQILWTWEVYTELWPRLAQLEHDVRAALRHVSTGRLSSPQVKAELAGSPAALAAIHKQSSQLLAGGETALAKRIRSLRGYPVVVNIWASTCEPCQKEFGLFAHASAEFGKNVAFLGADNEDLTANARAFLRSHPVSYPSYETTTPQLDGFLVGGLQGTPTTMFFSSRGKLTHVHIDQYTSQAELDVDIGQYALGRSGCTACG